MKKLLVTSCWLQVTGSIPPLKGGRGMSSNFSFSNFKFSCLLNTNY